jgi:hypothetical protein
VGHGCEAVHLIPWKDEMWRRIRANRAGRVLEEYVRANLGDLTFEEAYQDKTGAHYHGCYHRSTQSFKLSNGFQCCGPAHSKAVVLNGGFYLDITCRLREQWHRMPRISRLIE